MAMSNTRQLARAEQLRQDRKLRRPQPYASPRAVQAPPHPQTPGAAERLAPTPLGGLKLVPRNVHSSQLADWIAPEHRAPVAIVLAMSYPGWEGDKEGWLFVNNPRLKTVRIGVWRQVTGPCATYLVGFRATGIGQSGAFQDLADDAIVGGYNLKKTSCELNITGEGARILRVLIEQMGVAANQILLCGYSLGGTAALCLGAQFPGSRVISLAGGAPPTFPLRTGPGPALATHYTIVGDLISSHVDPRAARIVRVDKGYNNDWGILIPHLSGRFLRHDQPAGKPGVTPDQADDFLVVWAVGIRRGKPTGWQVAGTVLSTLWKLGQAIAAVVAPPVAAAMVTIEEGVETVQKAVRYGQTIAVCTNAIPGSRRDREGTCTMGQPTEAAQLCRQRVPFICLVDRYLKPPGPGKEGELEEDQGGGRAQL